MKRFRFYFYLIIFFFSFGRFMPVFYAPDFLHEFFSTWGTLIFIPAFCLLFIWLLIYFLLALPGTKESANRLKESISVLAIFVSLVFFQSVLVSLQDRIVILANSGRSSDDFINPIFGNENGSLQTD